MHNTLNLSCMLCKCNEINVLHNASRLMHKYVLQLINTFFKNAYNVIYQRYKTCACMLSRRSVNVYVCVCVCESLVY